MGTTPPPVKGSPKLPDLSSILNFPPMSPKVAQENPELADFLTDMDQQLKDLGLGDLSGDSFLKRAQETQAKAKAITADGRRFPVTDKPAIWAYGQDPAQVKAERIQRESLYNQRADDFDAAMEGDFSKASELHRPKASAFEDAQSLRDLERRINPNSRFNAQLFSQFQDSNWRRDSNGEPYSIYSPKIAGKNDLESIETASHQAMESVPEEGRIFSKKANLNAEILSRARILRPVQTPEALEATQSSRSSNEPLLMPSLTKTAKTSRNFACHNLSESSKNVEQLLEEGISIKPRKI